MSCVDGKLIVVNLDGGIHGGSKAGSGDDFVDTETLTGFVFRS